MKVWRQEKRYGVSFFSQSVKSVTELEEFSRRASQYAKQTVESCRLDQNKKETTARLIPFYCVMNTTGAAGSYDYAKHLGTEVMLLGKQLPLKCQFLNYCLRHSI